MTVTVTCEPQRRVIRTGRESRDSRSSTNTVGPRVPSSRSAIFVVYSVAGWAWPNTFTTRTSMA